MLEGYIGQADRLGALVATIESAKKTGKPLPNMLFLGKSGHGKTRLAQLVAKEMGKPLSVLHGPSAIDRSDVSKAVLAAKDGILFIDETHALSKRLCEDLYTVLDSGTITVQESTPSYFDTYIQVWSEEELPENRRSEWYGPGKYLMPSIVGYEVTEKTLNLGLTVIGATTDEGLLPSPFLRRLSGLKVYLRTYRLEEMVEIGKMRAAEIGVRIANPAMVELATRSRFNPRRMKQTVDIAAAFAIRDGKKTVTKAIASESLKLSGVDGMGLEPPHRSILDVLYTSGGLSRASLSQRLGIPSRNLDLHWSELLEQGLVQIDTRHRLTTKGKVIWETLNSQAWSLLVRKGN